MLKPSVSIIMQKTTVPIVREHNYNYLYATIVREHNFTWFLQNKSSRYLVEFPNWLDDLEQVGWGTRLLIDWYPVPSFLLPQATSCWGSTKGGKEEQRHKKVLEDLVNGKHEEENSRSLMKSDKSTSGQTIFVPTKWAADSFAARTLRWLATSSIWQGARYQIVTLAKPKLNSVNYDELQIIVKMPSFWFASLCLSGGSEFRSECGSRP